jgi:hypothetical protein
MPIGFGMSSPPSFRKYRIPKYLSPIAASALSLTIDQSIGWVCALAEDTPYIQYHDDGGAEQDFGDDGRLLLLLIFSSSLLLTRQEKSVVQKMCCIVLNFLFISGCCPVMT